MTTTCYLATAQTLKPKRLAERLGFMGFIIGFNYSVYRVCSAHYGVFQDYYGVLGCRHPFNSP